MPLSRYRTEHIILTVKKKIVVRMSHFFLIFLTLQIMYFSSLFPYVVLICFLIRALLLNGSIDGIRHMFTPEVCTVFLVKAYDHKSLMFIVKMFPQLDLRDNCSNLCALDY